jgi:mono/diheme cytochrome c family protein
MPRKCYLLVCWVVGLSGLTGCRQSETPRWTRGAEVVALTNDLEDEEEIKLYQTLQNEIDGVLAERCGRPDAPIALGEKATTETLERGSEVYAQYCVQCHGVNGDGQGLIAVHLKPRPRDYTQGVFKFTSTSNGKPRKADLVRTIRRGVTGTSMPSFATFSEEDLGAVVDYVLVLTHRGELQRELAQIAYDDEELPDDEGLDGIVEELLAPWREANRSVVMPLTPMPEKTAETVARGHELFLKFACSRCHGADGRGGSLGNVEVGKDMWGYKAAAADLTSGMFHGGGRPIDIYRRIYAGINGAPMGAFAGQFETDPDAIWHLVHFIKETGQRRRRGLPPLEPGAIPKVTPIDAAGSSTPSEEAPASDAEESTPTEEPVAEEPAAEAA